MVFIRPHIHICMVSIADRLDPSLQRKVGKFFLLRHSWLSMKENKANIIIKRKGRKGTREWNKILFGSYRN